MVERVVKKKPIFFIVFFLLLVIAGCAGYMLVKAKSKPSMKLYFLEFSARTYVPLTMEEMEGGSEYKIFFYGKHPFINDIQVLLEKKAGKKKFDNNESRLKVVISEDDEEDIIYYVDRHGVVIKNNKEAFLLNDDESDRLENNILYFHGVVDQKPTLGIKGYSPHAVLPSGYSPMFYRDGQSKKKGTDVDAQ